MVTTSSAANTGELIAAMATSAHIADAMNFTCITIPFFAEYRFPAPHLLFPLSPKKQAGPQQQVAAKTIRRVHCELMTAGPSDQSPPQIVTIRRFSPLPASAR